MWVKRMNQRSKKAVIEGYLRKVRRALPIPGKTKRALVQQIRESIYEQTRETATLDEAALVAKFGTPRQIVESYVENMSVSEFMDDMCVRQKVIRIVLAAVLVVFVIRTLVVGGAWLNHRINGSGEHITYYITDPAATEG
mgnify:CR=1 FL=1